jgi:hypothetical protein
VAACRTVPYSDPLDLLWRLVPTPYFKWTCVGHLPVRVESNDPEIVATVTEITPEALGETECAFLWRIVRDPNSTGGIQPATILTHGDLSFISMGTSLLVGVDCKRRELLGFVGVGVDRNAFKESVLPLLMRLTLDVAGSPALIGNGRPEVICAEGKGDE